MKLYVKVSEDDLELPEVEVRQSYDGLRTVRVFEGIQERGDGMSGGSLNYFYGQLEDRVGDFGDKELDELVKDLAKLFHDREWYLSGDYGKGTWIEARDAFKEKWFTKHGRQERIEKYLTEITNEVRESFGMVKGRCKNCKHWKRRTDYYGDCEYIKGCMKHRSDSCERYEVTE